ncbi:MAG: hypothetical protein V1834_00335 [Candidatus Micrarchaeota archaeon]
MVTVTISVPVDLKSKMDDFAEINWSEVARQAFSRKIRDLEFLKEVSSESTLTSGDAIKLGRKVNAALAKRYANG